MQCCLDGTYIYGDNLYVMTNRLLNLLLQLFLWQSQKPGGCCTGEEEVQVHFLNAVLETAEKSGCCEGSVQVKDSSLEVIVHTSAVTREFQGK